MDIKYYLISGTIIVIIIQGVVFALIPPPPVNQEMGVKDTLFASYTENMCRGCHTSGMSVVNADLTKLDMVVYENGVVRKDLSSKYQFKDSNEIKFELQVNSEFEVVFVPQGNPSSAGHVTIKRLIE